MKALVIVVLCLATSIAGPAQATSLTGDTVTCSSNWDCYNQSATIGDAVEFALPTLNFDFTGDSLVIPNPYSWVGLGNIEYDFTDATTPFTHAVITANSGVSGLTADQISISSAGTLSIRLGVLSLVTFAQGSSLTIGLSQSSAPAVPEPASWALMLGGFGLVGGAMRSRRKAAVSLGRPIYGD
jgi:hypothetical protein